MVRVGALVRVVVGGTVVVVGVRAVVHDVGTGTPWGYIPNMRTFLVALLVVLGWTLTACGEDAEPQALSDTEHSAQDVSFASDMVQHHAKALAMVDLTIGRDLDPEVQGLAEAIRAAQGPEIELMADWLLSWEEEVPETVRDHANADHGTPEDLEPLEQASDADFDELWLAMMIEHHEGAVAMARTQLDEGTYRPAVELAGDIVEAQEAEIERMRALLG